MLGYKLLYKALYLGRSPVVTPTANLVDDDLALSVLGQAYRGDPLTFLSFVETADTINTISSAVYSTSVGTHTMVQGNAFTIELTLCVDVDHCQVIFSVCQWQPGLGEKLFIKLSGSLLEFLSLGNGYVPVPSVRCLFCVCKGHTVVETALRADSSLRVLIPIGLAHPVRHVLVSVDNIPVRLTSVDKVLHLPVYDLLPVDITISRTLIADYVSIVIEFPTLAKSPDVVCQDLHVSDVIVFL